MSAKRRWSIGSEANTSMTRRGMRNTCRLCTTCSCTNGRGHGTDRVKKHDFGEHGSVPTKYNRSADVLATKVSAYTVPG